MDRIDAMRSFVQVVESGSFTQAAAALRRHKATVSDHVAQLENSLGVRLFTRTTRAVVPTAEGLAYARKVATILAELDEAEAALRTHTRAPQGLLKVEVPQSIGRIVVMPQIRSFLDRYPRVTLDLGCTDRITDLVKEGVDCAVRAGVLRDSSLVSRRLCEVRFALFASPAYLAQWGVPTRVEDLAQHQLVGYRNAAVGELFLSGLSRHGQTVPLSMPMRLIAADSASVLQAGLAGIGMIHASTFIAAQHVREGTLVRVLPDWGGQVIPLSLVSPSTRYRTARVRAFMDWVQEAIRRHMAVS